MAEIHVQPKKQMTPVWVWILVFVVILAVVAFFIVRNKNNKNNTATPPNQTSQLQLPQSPVTAYYL